MPVDLVFVPGQILPAAELNAAFAECAADADLAARGGAALIGTSTGSTVQAQLSALTLTSPVWGGLASGTANALVLTPMPPLTAYTAAQPLRYKAASTNTGAMTANWSGLGAVAVVTSSGAAMPAGDVVAGREYTQVYDPTTNTLVNQDASALGGPDGASQVGIVNTGSKWAGATVQSVVDGAAVDSLVVHLAGAETITGAKTFSGAAVFTSAGKFSGAIAASAGTTEVGIGEVGNLPYLYYTNSSAPTDAKIWQTYVDTSGIFHLAALNDASTAANPAITILRSGDAITSVALAGQVLVNGVANDGFSAINVQGYGRFGSGTAGLFVGSYTGGTHGSLYSTDVVPSGTNYILAADSGTTNLSSTSALNLCINGAIVAAISTGILSVTGTLSASNLSGTNTGDQTSVSGNSGSTNALKSATTTVTVSGATAPTSGQVLTATGGTAANWQTPSGGGGGLPIPGISGNWLTSGTVGGDLGAVALTATNSATGTLFFVPFFLSKTTIFTGIGVLPGATIGTSVVLGIYADSGAGAPTGSPIANSNSSAVSLAASTFASYTFSSPITLTAGVYWLAHSISGSATQLSSYGTSSPVATGFGIAGTPTTALLGTPFCGYSQTFSFSATLPAVGTLTKQILGAVGMCLTFLQVQ